MSAPSGVAVRARALVAQVVIIAALAAGGLWWLNHEVGGSNIQRDEDRRIELFIRSTLPRMVLNVRVGSTAREMISYDDFVYEERVWSREVFARRGETVHIDLRAQIVSTTGSYAVSCRVVENNREVSSDRQGIDNTRVRAQAFCRHISFA